MDMSATIVAATKTVMTMPSSTATAASTAAAMMMGDTGGCKLSMLLNWHTIDACFLSSALHIRTPFTFFLTCLSSFLLVISLEFLRRSQRAFDRYLRARHAHVLEKEYVLTVDDMEEKLLEKDEMKSQGRTIGGKGRLVVVVLEQALRGAVNMVQFAVSYVVMLLFMYSNGYIIFSILLGSLVGFALFTRDTLASQKTQVVNDEENKVCC